jgi:hypothetical protein
MGSRAAGTSCATRATCAWVSFRSSMPSKRRELGQLRAPLGRFRRQHRGDERGLHGDVGLLHLRQEFGDRRLLFRRQAIAQHVRRQGATGDHAHARRQRFLQRQRDTVIERSGDGASGVARAGAAAGACDGAFAMATGMSSNVASAGASAAGNRCSEWVAGEVDVAPSAAPCAARAAILRRSSPTSERNFSELMRESSARTRSSSGGWVENHAVPSLSAHDAWCWRRTCAPR